MNKLRSGNVIKHKKQTDVAFEIIGTLPSTKGYIIVGHWISILSSVPYILATDKISILRDQIDDWEDYHFFDKRLH